MSDPKRIHDIEQGLAAWAAMGAQFARMYREMTDAGVPGRDAAHIIGALAAGFFRQRQDPPAP